LKFNKIVEIQELLRIPVSIEVLDVRGNPVENDSKYSLKYLQNSLLNLQELNEMQICITGERGRREETQRSIKTYRDNHKGENILHKTR